MLPKLIQNLLATMKLRSWGGFVLVGAGVVLIGLMLLSRFSAQADVATVTAKPGTVVQEVITSGNVKAGGLAEVFPETTGIVTEIYVTNNQIVEKGQELLKIESSASQAEEAQALAAYQAAVKDRQQAEQNKLLTQSQLEAARTDILNARSAIDDRDYERIYNGGNPVTDRHYTQEELDAFDSVMTSAQQRFSSLEKQYIEYDQVIRSAKAYESAAWKAYQATQDGVTVAPVSGTVANLQPVIGDQAVARPATDAQPVLTLTNTNAFQVKIEVREADINLIELGQAAEVVLDALPDKTFQAVIVKIDDLGVDDDGVIRYSVWLELNNPTTDVRHMMTAVAHIKVAEKKNVVTVPTSAIKENDLGKYVEVLRDEEIIEQSVKLGLMGTESVEIVEGVSVGDEVVIPTSS